MPTGLSLADFKAVFFDVDGTLVDTLPALVKGLGDSYEHFNGIRPSDDQIMGTIGTPLSEQMRLYTDARLSDAEVDERILYTIGRYEAHAHLEQEFEPAIRALHLARESGKRTALITSK